MRIIEPCSPEEFRRYYDLRWRILRAPWNQPRGTEQDPADKTSTHMMVIGDKQKLLGVGRLHFNIPGEAQIRFMAVDTKYQRKGTGVRLLKALEQKAAQLGARQIVLDSRETALGFYRKQGYRSVGPGHILFGSIPHMKMRKILRD